MCNSFPPRTESHIDVIKHAARSASIMPDTLKTWNTASMAVPIYMKWLKVLSFKENVKPLDSPYWIFPTRPCQLHLVMSKCWLDGLESESLWRRAFRSARVNTCRAAFTREGRRWSVVGLVSSFALEWGDRRVGWRVNTKKYWDSDIWSSASTLHVLFILVLLN